MELKRLDPDDPRPAFSCGDGDLDEYFAVDSKDGGRELLSVTYVHLDQGGRAIAYLSVSNDSIKRSEMGGSTMKRIWDLIPGPKRYSSMPSVKIGRLAVSQQLQSQGVGTKILDYVKVWFTRNNKTGCRYIVVDAYNNERAIKFYKDNGFVFLTGKDESDETRLMYFDLILFRP